MKHLELLHNAQPMNYEHLIQQLWQGQMQFAALLEHAQRFEAQGQAAQASMLYLAWLEGQPAANPFNRFAWFNLGVSRLSRGQVEAAEHAYLQALLLDEKLYQARYNLGLVRERQGRIDDALQEWERMLEQLAEDASKRELSEDEKSLEVSALNSLGRVQEQRKRYGEALGYYNRSLAVQPNQRDVLHHWIFVRARQCLWPVYDAPEGVDEQLMHDSTSALAQLALYDDPEMQLKRARSYAEMKAPAIKPALANPNGYGHKKLRIGYCSSDFCTHPVSMLTVELFERHNRDQFEVYGFCWSPNDGSPLRQRVITAFDHYIPIHDLDEEASARLIREHEIDILIDLQGQTSGARLNMLAYRPAPVQITYLGLPATTGMPTIDYVIGDEYLIPPELQKYYSEQVIYMPDVYQSSDSKRQNNAPRTKKEYGLPGRKFVFCSFNNNYKYTLEVFTSWMNILKRVPNSVLWLLSDNEWSEENLKAAAQKQDVDPKRLVFTKRCAPEDYLAQYLRADLFLDTYPFNAGTTANDALWMGLPVLTMSGKSFASRMAGALLTAAGLPELITDNLQSYEDQAVALAEDKKALKAIKDCLAKAKTDSPLFDMAGFLPKLEERLQDVWATTLEQKLSWQQELLTKPAAHSAPQITKLPKALEILKNPVSAISGSKGGLKPLSNLDLYRYQSVVDIVRTAEKKQQEGKAHEAAEAYQEWLKHNINKDSWMVHLNLAVLLRDQGYRAQAEPHFAAVRRMRPGFLK